MVSALLFPILVGRNNEGWNGIIKVNCKRHHAIISVSLVVLEFNGTHRADAQIWHFDIDFLHRELLAECFSLRRAGFLYFPPSRNSYCGPIKPRLATHLGSSVLKQSVSDHPIGLVYRISYFGCSHVGSVAWTVMCTLLSHEAYYRSDQNVIPCFLCWAIECSRCTYVV